MANKRIYYAVQQVAFAPDGSTTLVAARGVQSVGTNSSFNLTQVFELGQQAIYENIEGIPTVEVTLEKVLDGHPPLYVLATKTATSPTLAGRSNEKCSVHLGIWNDTDTSTNTAALSRVEMSGMFVGSSSVQIPVDGNMTESITLIGNTKLWAGGNYTGAQVLSDITFDSPFSANSDVPFAINGSGGVNRRENLIFNIQNSSSGLDVNSQVRDPNVTILPRDLPGVTSSGTNERGADGNFGWHGQRISVSCDFGRQELFELGRLGPYHRFISFPTQVTSEFECYSVSGDMISFHESGIYVGTTGTTLCPDRYNLRDNTIRIATCEGTRIYLGKKNKLSSVSYGGGNADGGNVTTTYSYSTFNDYTYCHMNDPSTSLRPTGINGYTFLAPS